MRISDWSSDVCSSYLRQALALVGAENSWMPLSVSPARTLASLLSLIPPMAMLYFTTQLTVRDRSRLLGLLSALALLSVVVGVLRSEEHTSELQSLMRISYAVFCLKKKTHN